MLRSFDGLRCARCAPGRCAPFSPSFGIVLGVGMVFGVLLLVGTIRSTFDDLFDSVWGKTDLIVIGTVGPGLLPDSTLDDRSASRGVRERRSR